MKGGSRFLKFTTENRSTGSQRIFHCLERRKKKILGHGHEKTQTRRLALFCGCTAAAAAWSQGKQIIGRWFVKSGWRTLVKGRRLRREKPVGTRWEICSVSPSDCPSQAPLNFPKFIFHSAAVWFVRPRWPSWFGKVDSFDWHPRLRVAVPPTLTAAALLWRSACVMKCFSCSKLHFLLGFFFIFTNGCLVKQNEMAAYSVMCGLWI